MASVNFQALGQPNRQGTNLPSVKSFPLSEGRKQSKEGRSNDSKHQKHLESIHLLKRNNHRA
jgi:hypothetical protein